MTTDSKQTSNSPRSDRRLKDMDVDIEDFRVPTHLEFRALRINAGVTQYELGDHVGTSQALFSNYERGEAGIQYETLRDAIEYIRDRESEN